MKKFFEAIPGFFGSKWVKLTSTNLAAAGLQDVVELGCLFCRIWSSAALSTGTGLNYYNLSKTDVL